MKSTTFFALAGLLSLSAIGNAVAKPETPVMSHEVATLIQLTHQAEAQYRRSGSPQDLARVRAMRIELASRGFGKSTQVAPAVLSTQTPSISTPQDTRTTVASTAQ